MLKLLLLALLIVGCKCIEPYTTEVGNKWFYSMNNMDEWMRMPRCIPRDDKLAFTVNRESDDELVFRPSSGGLFKCGRETAQLTYISIRFFTVSHPKLNIGLKSLDTFDKTWTVRSQMFTTPRKLTDWLDAERDAVILNSLDERFAAGLDGQQEKLKNRDTTLELDWVRDVLLRDTPRLLGEIHDQTSSGYAYAGLPVVIDRKVFDILDKVKDNMEKHRML